MTQQQGKPDAQRVLFFGALCSGKSVAIPIVLLLFATVCFGGNLQEDGSGDTDTPVSPDRQGIAPNQSASLDDLAALNIAAPSFDHSTEHSSETGEASDVAASGELVSPVSKNQQARSTGMNEILAVDPSDEAPTQGAVRVGRRISRDKESMTRSAPTLPAVAWYRTGIGALGIVLAVIGVAVWGIRRWMPRLGGAGCSVLNVVGRAGLSPKHSVALVSVGQRFVLVGLSGDRMTRICEVSDPQEVAELTLRLGQSSSLGKPVSGGGSAKAFESLLAGEVNEYAHDLEPASTDARRATDRQGENAPQSRSHRTREPLSALLERLRSLQLKK